MADVESFGARGLELWEQMTAEGAAPLGPAQLVLLEEACRIADRLDRLDAALQSGEDAAWLTFQANESGDEVRVVVDGVLGEARQQATALRGLVAEITKTAQSAPPAAADDAAEKALGALRERAGLRLARPAS